MREKTERVDDFLRVIQKPHIQTPDHIRDFGMYQQMNAAFDGLHEHLNYLMRNQGRIGFASQNLMSDLSKAFIVAAQENDEEEMAYMEYAMEQLVTGLDERAVEIAESGNRSSRTSWQERHEAELFGKIWPVIVGTKKVVPELTHWKNFQGKVQAFLYGYLDVVTELAKTVDKKLYRLNESEELANEDEFKLFERYIDIADSIILHLEQLRHIPGYIINNGYSRFATYKGKLYKAEGCVARMRQRYNDKKSYHRAQTR